MARNGGIWLCSRFVLFGWLSIRSPFDYPRHPSILKKMLHTFTLVEWIGVKLIILCHLLWACGWSSSMDEESDESVVGVAEDDAISHILSNVSLFFMHVLKVFLTSSLLTLLIPHSKAYARKEVNKIYLFSKRETFPYLRISNRAQHHYNKYALHIVLAVKSNCQLNVVAPGSYL